MYWEVGEGQSGGAVTISRGSWPGKQFLRLKRPIMDTIEAVERPRREAIGVGW